MEATWGAASLVAVIKYSTKSNLSWPRVPEETQSITAGRHKKARQEVWKQRVEVGSESSCKPSRPHPLHPHPHPRDVLPPQDSPNSAPCWGTKHICLWRTSPIQTPAGGIWVLFCCGWVCLFVGWSLFDNVSSPGWTRIPFVGADHLALLILLPLPPECSD